MLPQPRLVPQEGVSRRRSLGELRSFAGASFSRQLGARELRQLIQWYDRKHTKEIQTRPAAYLAVSAIALAVLGYSSIGNPDT